MILRVLGYGASHVEGRLHNIVEPSEDRAGCDQGGSENERD
jgi:hypothetical protein